MTSDPVIQSDLSATEREFVERVESRAGSSDGRARYHVAIADTDEDIAVHRHDVEVMAAPDDIDEPIRRVSHTMKRIESAQSRYSLVESRFEISGPRIPSVTTCHAVMERAVRAWLRR
jgi:hypothetical protein